MEEDHNWINYLDRNHNLQYTITSDRTFTYDEVTELMRRFRDAPNNYVFNTVIGVDAEPPLIKYTYKYGSEPVFKYTIQYKENNDDEEYDVGSFEDIL